MTLRMPRRAPALPAAAMAALLLSACGNDHPAADEPPTATPQTLHCAPEPGVTSSAQACTPRTEQPA